MSRLVFISFTIVFNIVITAKSHVVSKMEKWPRNYKTDLHWILLIDFNVLSTISAVNSHYLVCSTVEIQYSMDYISLQILNQTLDTYAANEIFLSFNGGKDCTVLLHMFAGMFTKRYPNETLLCLYIQPDSPFDEIEQFIDDCKQKYRITIETIRGTVKTSLFEICQRYPHLKAVVMGCRRTDPYCSDLNNFQVIPIFTYLLM